MSEYSEELTRPDLVPPKKKRGPRWYVVVLIVVVVLLGITIIGDRLALSYAEGRVASEIQKQGFGAKPTVKIYGFPFLTQVASRRFPHGHLSARNVHEGPVTISTIDATARDVRVNSGFDKGSIGSVDGTATVGFDELIKAGDAEGVELSADGPDKVKATVDLDVISGTAIAQVTKAGNGIKVHAISVEGFDLSDLGDTLDFTVPIQGLPMGMRFDSLKVTSKGVAMRVTGSHVTF